MEKRNDQARFFYQPAPGRFQGCQFHFYASLKRFIQSACCRKDLDANDLAIFAGGFAPRPCGSFTKTAAEVVQAGFALQKSEGAEPAEQEANLIVSGIVVFP